MTLRVQVPMPVCSAENIERGAGRLYKVACFLLNKCIEYYTIIIGACYMICGWRCANVTIVISKHSYIYKESV